MADLQAIVEWPGLEAVESFSGTLSHGASPSVFRISCFPQKKPPKKSGKLTLRYGNTKVTLSDCIIDSASYSFNQSGDVIGLNILDRRWRWRGGFILGNYNTVQYGGGLEPGKAAGSKNLKELMKFCLDEMGETKADLSDVSTTFFPEVNWDYDNPASALQQLCTQFNYRIVLQTTDKVKICKANQGAKLSSELPYEGYGTAVDSPDLPDSVMVVGRPLLVEFDCELEAVGQELGGEWKPINDLSYAPTGGWTSEAPGDEFSNDDDMDLYGGLANKYIWKAYRVKRAERKAVKTLDIAGVPKSHDLTTVNIVNEITLVDRPVFRNIVYPALGSFVWGRYYSPDLIGAADDDHNTTVAKPILSTLDTLINGQNVTQIDFSIMTTEESYIVLFREPVYSLDTSDNILPATLYLRSFFEVGYSKDKALSKNSSAKPSVRYTEYELLGNPVNGKNLPLIFNQDDLEEIYDIGGKLVSRDVKQIAKRYLRERIDQLKNEQPEEVEYTGWHKIELDGAIQVISWNMGQGGATMRVSRNQDYGSPTTLSYAERLRFQEQKTQQLAIEKLKKQVKK